MNKRFFIYTFKLLSIVALISMSAFSVIDKTPRSIFAQSADELRDKIDQQNKEIERLEAEIKLYSAQLVETGKQANSLQNEVKELDLSRKKLLTDIKVTENKINGKNLLIKKLELEIGKKSTSIDTNTTAIHEGIRRVNERDQTTLIEALLNNGDFSDIWREVDETLMVQEKVRGHIVVLHEVKGELEGDKDEETKAKRELEGLKSELGAQKKIVDQNTAEKNRLLKETKNQESAYKALVAQKQALKAQFQKEIDEFESKLQYILDPSKLPDGVVFSWPLDNVFVTQRFGITSSSGRLYASGSHSGIDFRASVGTPVRAMADGVVEGIGDTDLSCRGASFGKWVFIRYNNGLASTYGHLSLATAQEGQKVRRGDIVAYSGNTGYSTGPHLHVSVYASEAVKVDSKPSISCKGKIFRQPLAARTAYLDALQYLPRNFASKE
jgi:murein DD-endopeptidase MepM/ murein hydrolase activator NlpD